MKTREALLREVREDIEAFGKDKIVYPYLLDGVLKDYQLESKSVIADCDTLENLLFILEDED